jgi:anti-sigma B factor antagonist
MWNPFSQRPDRDASEDPASGAEQPDGVPTSSIAQVQMMGTVAIATVTADELTRDDGVEQLADLLEAMSQSGATDYILDLQNVQFMDTACLGCLVEALNRLAGHGGQIALACPNHNVDYVFRLTRLDRVFRICASVMAALEQLEKRRAAG